MTRTRWTQRRRPRGFALAVCGSLAFAAAFAVGVNSADATPSGVGYGFREESRREALRLREIAGVEAIRALSRCDNTEGARLGTEALGAICGALATIVRETNNEASGSDDVARERLRAFLVRDMRIDGERSTVDRVRLLLQRTP